MRKILLSFALILAHMAATAAVVNPVQEVNYRTNANDPTAWSYVKVADATNQQFEVKYSARIFVVQSWAIPAISQATELNIYHTRVSGQTQNGALCMWAFPYAVETTTTFSVEEGSFLANVKTVLGVYPGDTALSKLNQPLATSVAGKDSADNDARVLTIDANAIKALKNAGKVSGDTLYVNMLISTLKSVNDQNLKYYSIGSTEKKPYMTVSSAAPAVSNLTSGMGYSTLAAAVSAAAAGDTLQLNEDVTVSGNRIESTVALTIIGKTGNEKILRATDLNNITLLPKKALTLKNLVLDGQNINRQKPAIEASNDLVALDNVTIQNFKRTDSGQTQGIITIKNKGKVNFTNTTFSGNEVLEGYGDVFMGLHKAVTLAGNNTIPNGIFVEKDTLGIVDNAATHTVAIDLIVPATHKTGTAYPLVYGTTNASNYNLVTTQTAWSLAAGESFLYIYDTSTALNQQSAIINQQSKFIQNGKLYLRRGDAIYSVLGTKQ